MQEQQFGFEKYSAGIREALSKHAEDGTVSCLMNNHKVWKISFGVLLRWIEDFKAVKERLGLRDGDRAVVLSGNTVDAFATFLVLSANHLTAVMADAAAFDIQQMFACTKEERTRFWKKNLLGYCLHSPIVGGAADTIAKLRKDGHRIYIVTSRVYATRKGAAGALFRAMLKGWLKRRGVVYDGIAFCEDSGEDKLKHCGRFGVDVMIDDKPENIRMIAEKCAVIAHPMPWNRHLASEGYIVAKDWADIYRIISRMKEGNVAEACGQKSMP